ncbi:MAG TPA: hypothetical protein VFT58_00805, partial [Nitrososphaera sp.]|nr:hypothetical protein [Nitrososphaera sp.]
MCLGFGTEIVGYELPECALVANLLPNIERFLRARFDALHAIARVVYKRYDRPNQKASDRHHANQKDREYSHKDIVDLKMP